MGWMETDERLIMMGELILDLNLLEKHEEELKTKKTHLTCPTFGLKNPTSPLGVMDWVSQPSRCSCVT
jgi:hypothetical protein